MVRSFDDAIIEYWRHVRRRIAVARSLGRLLGVRRYHLFVPVVLSITISGLDAIGLGLLAPLAQGVTTGSFAALYEQPYLGPWLQSLTAIMGEATLVNTFLLLGVLIIMVNVLAVIIGYGNAYFGRYLQGMYHYRLQTTVYDRYFSLGKRYFDQTSQGYLKKILEYTTRIVEMVRISQNFLTNAARLVAYVAVLLWLSWQLFLLVLVAFPVLYVLTRLVMRVVNRSWDESKNITLELGRESFNMLSALPLVWSYSQEKQAAKNYAALNERLRRAQLRAQSLGDLAVVLPRTLTLVTMLVVIIIVASRISDGAVQDLSQFVVFLYVTSRTVPLLKVFNEFWVALSEMMPPAREIVRLFRDKDKHMVTSGTVQFTTIRDGIRFTDLSFTYGNENILSHVAFTARAGETTALVGPSGSGKSTLVNLLMRFYDCPPDSIYLDGTDIRDFNASSLRQKIALVNQEPLLLHDTLAANLAYGLPSVTKEQLTTAIADAQLEPLVARLDKGLNAVIGDRGVQLSGGEQQRVAIARALLKNADIILLDEATSALDSITEEQIQVALRKVLAGRTAIVVAHRLATITHADQIIYMDTGKVVEAGTFQELSSRNTRFAAQWQRQRL